MPKKEVFVSVSGFIGKDPRYEPGWEDVWLKFKGKPGRMKYSYGPTLLSKLSAQADLDISLELQRLKGQRIDKSWMSEGLARLYEGEEFYTCDFSEEIDRHRYILGHIKYEDDIFIDTENQSYRDKIPNIYSGRALLNYGTINRMISFFMKHLGYPDCKLKWDKSGFSHKTYKEWLGDEGYYGTDNQE